MGASAVRAEEGERGKQEGAEEDGAEGVGRGGEGEGVVQQYRGRDDAALRDFDAVYSGENVD